MPKLTLYHAAPSRSSIVHWMLEELGEPYDIHLVSFKKGENLSPSTWPSIRWARCPRSGTATRSSPRRRHLHLSRRRVPKAKLNVPVAIPAAASISSGCSSGRAAWSPPSWSAPIRARTRRPPRSASAIRHVVEVLAEAAGAAEPLPAGRAVHRCRRDHRLRPALGHDVQAAARAAGVRSLHCTPERPPRPQARDGQGRPAGRSSRTG